MQRLEVIIKGEKFIIECNDNELALNACRRAIPSLDTAKYFFTFE